MSDPKGQFEVIFLPGNTTSVSQPLDQGIISILKAAYKRRLLEVMVQCLEDYDRLQLEALKIPQGRRGLQYGQPAHLLDAAILLKECWENLSPSTIVGCFNRSRCFLHAEVSIPNEFSSDDIAQSNIDQIEILLSRVRLSSSSSDYCGLGDIIGIYKEEGPQAGAATLKRWISLEDDPEVLASIDQDEMDAIESTFDQAAAVSISRINHPSNTTTEQATSPHSTAQELVAMLEDAKKKQNPFKINRYWPCCPV